MSAFASNNASSRQPKHDVDSPTRILYKQKVKRLLSEYRSCLLISKQNVSSSQFTTLRRKYCNTARFLMGRNAVIRETIREYVHGTNESQWSLLLPYIRGQCGLVFTNESDLSAMKKQIESNVRQTAAKIDQIAPADVIIPAGPTILEPTQTAYFSVLNIPTRIQRGKVHIEDAVQIINKGERINMTQAIMLQNLQIKPFLYGPRVLYVLHEGKMYGANVLDITAEQIQNAFSNAVQQVAALCAEFNQVDSIVNVPFSVLHAYKEAIAFGLALDSYSWSGLDTVKHALDCVQIEALFDFSDSDSEEEDSCCSSSATGPGLFGADSSSECSDSDGYIGLSVGGAKDVNNFRQCIERDRVPSEGSITYNGLLYEYYFDTKTRKSMRLQSTDENNNDDESKENKPDGSNLFYPTYCYAKVQKLDFVSPSTSDIRSDSEFEYYMTVGMNSNIKKSEFKRKHLNLVILLDNSGSMGYSQSDWNRNSKFSQTPMETAIEACLALLTHLTAKDRIGVVTFESTAKIIQSMEFINDLNMDALCAKIRAIKATGGTNFERGYKTVLNLYKRLFQSSEFALNSCVMDNCEYDNRIILITDAQPNEGMVSSKSLLSLMSKYAQNTENIHHRIYTTFIGVGLDFNASLIECISQTRGCNYYSVKSADEFRTAMDDEFEMMVTPLVFDVCLSLQCEGDSCHIAKVYGCKSATQICETGEIRRIHTLFASKRSKKKGGTKGGIQLIKLAKKASYKGDNINVEVRVSFEDRYGNRYVNTQMVHFEPPELHKVHAYGDMIEDESDEEEQNVKAMNFYDNTGIRKAILLVRYVGIMQDWMKECQQTTDRVNLHLNEKYRNVFTRFVAYFEKELKRCKDDELQKEVQLMHKILKW